MGIEIDFLIVAESHPVKGGSFFYARMTVYFMAFCGISASLQERSVSL